MAVGSSGDFDGTSNGFSEREKCVGSVLTFASRATEKGKAKPSSSQITTLGTTIATIFAAKHVHVSSLEWCLIRRNTIQNVFAWNLTDMNYRESGLAYWNARLPVVVVLARATTLLAHSCHDALCF
jgi:hypothetical protein